MRREKVLVVGTTADYVARIEQAHPGRCLFLTDTGHRIGSRWPAPAHGGEMVADLSQPAAVRVQIQRHLAQHAVSLVGITSFDCESMGLAAELGAWTGLPYPSPGAIATVRNKHATTSTWLRAGVPCPQSTLVDREDALVRFFHEQRAGVVVKPLSGSGSELVFACRDERDCREAFRTLRARLSNHRDARMYAPIRRDGYVVDPRRVFVAEELIEGTEISCDFIVERGFIDVIRVMRKIPAAGEPLGTVGAYVMPAESVSGARLARLREQLGAAAAAVGLTRAICVVDIVERQGEFVLLEIAPRLAGDCVPALTEASTGIDPFGIALDFAAGMRPALPGPESWRRLVAVRLLARHAGRVSALEWTRLASDPRLTDIQIDAVPGDVVRLPPDSCDCRLLGHAIFAPREGRAIELQCAEIAALLDVEIEPLTLNPTMATGT